MGQEMKAFFPFGPPIGHAELPKEMIDDLNKGCDKIAKDKEYLSQKIGHKILLVMLNKKF